MFEIKSGTIDLIEINQEKKSGTLNKEISHTYFEKNAKYSIHGKIHGKYIHKCMRNHRGLINNKFLSKNEDVNVRGCKNKLSREK